MVWSQLGKAAGNTLDFAGGAGNNGLFNNVTSAAEGLANYGSKAMDWMNTNKDGLSALGGLAGGYMNYQANKDAQGIAKQQLALQNKYYTDMAAERERQLGKEELNTSNWAQGFSSGYIRKKKPGTSYANTPLTDASQGLAATGAL